MSNPPDFFDQRLQESQTQQSPLESLRIKVTQAQKSQNATRDRIEAIANAGALLAGDDRADLAAIFETLAQLAGEWPGLYDVNAVLQMLEGGAA